MWVKLWNIQRRIEAWRMTENLLEKTNFIVFPPNQVTLIQQKWPPQKSCLSCQREEGWKGTSPGKWGSMKEYETYSIWIYLFNINSTTEVSLFHTPCMQTLLLLYMPKPSSFVEQPLPGKTRLLKEERWPSPSLWVYLPL